MGKKTEAVRDFIFLGSKITAVGDRNHEIKRHLLLGGKKEGQKVETVTDFIFLGSKITVDGDCSHEIKRHFLLRKKL